MSIKRPSDIKSSEITDEKDYLDRRKFIGATTAALLAAGGSHAVAQDAEAGVNISGLIKSRYSTGENETPFDKASGYVNFYEFALDKHSPARLARNFRTDPWTVSIEGEAKKTGVYNLEDILRPHKLEERIYRMRCVEAWSMVIPWMGFPLGDLLKRFEPTSKARFVEFETLYDPKQMPGQGDPVLKWPYREGLRMDEAVHPLTIMAVGMYGRVLPNQNGAPLRLVVPWKYGFKSVKSIVKIRFTEKQPISSWTEAAPREYGFYANVNPEVDHPRWSQATERRIGDMLRKKTLMFNGYGDQVEQLYRGMDLRKNF